MDEIHKAEKMHDFVMGTVPDKFVADTDQKLLVAAIFSLTAEHHGAILYMLKAVGSTAAPLLLYGQ